MLVLSRRKGERVLVGENIWVQVVDVCGDKVRLGIDAPESIPIDREEIAMLKSFGRLETVAELEICGLSLRLINCLEELGCIYIRDLEQLDETTVLAQPNMGKKCVKQIQEALKNFRDRRIVKTASQCLIQPDDTAGRGLFGVND